MKNFLLVALLPAGLFADQVNVSNFGTSDYADTEIATNIAFQVDNNMFNRLELELQLNPSLINNLEIAIGIDSDADGKLSLDETDMAFGYDCGKWFVRSSENNMVNLSDADSSETPIRRLILKRSEMNPLWNMVKVVRRGRGEIAELVSVKQCALGMRILVQ